MVKAPRQRVGRPFEWTATVDNLGRIKHAVVETAPLVMLLGKNNTGKSYVASVLWALCETNLVDQPVTDITDDLPWFRDFLEKATDASASHVMNLTEQRCADVKVYFNKVWHSQCPLLLKDVFAYNGFQTASVQVSSPAKCELQIELRWVPRKAAKHTDFYINVSVRRGDDVVASYGDIPVGAEKKIPDYLGEFIFRILLDAAVFGSTRNISSEYIPAARTGLMIAYRSLIAEMFSNLGMESRAMSTFAMPTRQFLQSITWGAGDGSYKLDTPYSRIADWLEERLLLGKIKRSGSSDKTEFSYEVKAGLVLPLHAISSMVTELIPFLLILRYSTSLGQLVFEEPEAHLHLSAQRLMAQAIVRLVNAGTRVIVTSHSDTFVQQINNLMQLTTNNEQLMLSLNYERDDILDPNMVRGYEFISLGDETEVRELEKIDEGLVVPSLNMTIEKLQEESLRLQEANSNGID